MLGHSETSKSSIDDYDSEQKRYSMEHGATEALVENFGRHRIFTWVKTEWGEENVDIEDSEVAEKYGVPRKLLVRSIRSEIQHEEAFLTLPWAILLVATFAVCLIGHDRTNQLRDVEEAANVDFHENANFAFSNNMGHKEINDAHYPADVYTWLRGGFAPLLFKSHKGWSESFGESPDTPLTPAQKKAYLQYNRVVGGVRLSQARAKHNTCSNEKVSNIYDLKCDLRESTRTRTGIDLTVQPEYLEIVSTKEDYDPKFTRWFLLDEGPSSVEDRMKQLEATDWIDSSTVHVAVHFLSYNAHYNSLTLSGAHFYFARTGRLWKKAVHSGVFLNTYEHVWVAVFDAIFVLLVIRLVVLEVMDIAHHFKHSKKFREWLIEYMNIWNIVDWISIGLTIAMVIMWIRICLDMQALEQEFIDVATEENSKLWVGRIVGVFEGQLDVLMEHFETLYNYQHKFRIVACLFPICLGLRLFKAFSAQPRLALVTQTLSLAMVDVSHFLVVFFSIFSTFVLMAVALFGRESHDFSEWWRAFNTCFLVLMGDFDYEFMVSEARGMGSLWFWLFQIILVLLMLNMLLAIIMDTYSEVKTKSSNMETLPEQAWTLVRRWQWIRRGEGLPLEKIDQKLIQMFGKVKKKDLRNIDIHTKWDPEDIISVQGLADSIDGMETLQAQRLITLAVRNWRLEHLEQLSLKEAMNVISLIHRSLMDQTKSIMQNHQQLQDQNELLKGSLGARQSGGEDKEPNNHEGGASAMTPALSVQSNSQDRIDWLELELKAADAKVDAMSSQFAALVSALKSIEQHLDEPVVSETTEKVSKTLCGENCIKSSTSETEGVSRSNWSMCNGSTTSTGQAFSTTPAELYAVQDQTSPRSVQSKEESKGAQGGVYGKIDPETLQLSAR